MITSLCSDNYLTYFFTRFEGKFIKVRTPLPGLPVQVSIDGGKSWNDVKEDTQIMENEVIVRTR